MVLKKLKPWGAGLGIYFSKEEIENYGLAVDKLVDIDDIVIKNKRKVKKKK